MRNTKRCLAAVLTLVVLLAQAAAAEAAQATLPSGTAFEDAGGIIEQYVSEHEPTTAGMSVSIFQRDTDIYTNYFGYADKEEELPVDQDTVMEWGSATKLLVWVSVMQLWESGQLDLDRDIRDYLPEGFLTNLNYDTPITMKNLMNHNAGFQDCYADLFIKEEAAIGTLESSLKAHKPEQIYEPGTLTAYSNWGVALAGFIVERISGQSFDAYVHQHIFEPLGMEHSALAADLNDNTWVREKRKELQCYTTDGTLIPDCFYYITLYPAGMCTSTLGDFALFGKALLNADSPLFGKRETWETLFSPTAYLGDSEIPSNYHGFWTDAYGVETVGHGGNTAGCSSYLLLDLKSGIGCVVMTNQSQEIVYNYEMMELIFGRFSEENYFDAERVSPKGIYRTARMVRVGPHKLMSLSFLSEPEADQFWMTGSDGTEKICAPVTDLVRVPVWLAVWEIGLVVLWVAAVLFSVICLIVKGIGRIRGRHGAVPLGGWSTLAACLQIAAFILLAAMAMLSLRYATSDTYVWMIAAIGIIMAAMIGASCWGIRKICTTELTKGQKCFNWASAAFLVIAAANIVYWNLFMFWKL